MQHEEQIQTIDTKVFRLLEEGKTPIQVAIDLNLPSAEVTKLQREYWSLKGLHELDKLYEEIRNNVFEFQRIYKVLKNHGYTPWQLTEAAEHMDKLPMLRSEHELLKQENQILEDQKERLDKEIIDAKQELTHINFNIDFDREAIRQLQRQKFNVQTALVSLNTSAGYQHLLKTVEDTSKNILGQNQAVLVAALCALLKALREEPKSQLHLLVYGHLNYPVYNPVNGIRPQNYAQLQQALLLKSAEEMYQDLLTKILHHTMFSILNTPIVYDPSHR